jgi:hypothetical protein
MTGPRPDVAVEVPTSPGAVGGAGAPAHVGALVAGGALIQQINKPLSREVPWGSSYKRAVGRFRSAVGSSYG